MPIAFAPSSHVEPSASATSAHAAADRPTDAACCFHCGLPTGAAQHALRAEVGGMSRAFCCAGCLALAQALDQAGFAHLYGGEFRFGRPLDGAARARLEPVWQAYDTEELRARFVRRLDGATEARPEERPQQRPQERFEITLAPENIRCAACAWLIEQKLAQLPGVETAVANLATRRVLVRWRGRALTVAALLGALADIGYTAWPFEFSAADRQDSAARRGLLMRLAVAMLGMMQVMMYAWPVYTHEGTIAATHLRLLQWASLALTLPVIVYSAAPVFAGAWRSLRQRHVGMDVPVALGLAAAFGASLLATVRGTGEVYYDSVTMFVALLLLARYLELRVRQASRSGAEMLARQLPATCEQLFPDGTVRRVPVARLAPGDRVRVRAGEIVPADGEILEGSSDLDESMLSGESRPVPRGPGQAVLAGCYNASSPLVIAVRRVGAGTRLAEIVALLERALADKPRLAVIADRVAAWFVAALLLIAAAVGLLWWAIAPERALMVTVAVLVVSCPCALSLATPAALAAAGAALSRRGVLLTRGHALETLAGVTDVVLDKTGTLTEGRFAVANVIALGRVAQAECLALAAALCRGGEHPVARALVAAAERAASPGGVSGSTAGDLNFEPRLTQLRNRPGQGVEALLDGRPIRVGRRDFVEALVPPVLVPPHAGAARAGYAGAGSARSRRQRRRPRCAAPPSARRRLAGVAGRRRRTARRLRAVGHRARAGGQPAGAPARARPALPSGFGRQPADGALVGPPFRYRGRARTRQPRGQARLRGRPAARWRGGTCDRRWHQRWAGAGPGAGVDRAGQRRAACAGRRRCGADPRRYCRHRHRAGHRAPRTGGDPAEPGLGLRLQRGGHSAGGQRPCHRLDGRGRHVAVLAAGGRQCLAAAARAEGALAMDTLFLLVPMSLALVALIAAALWWALRAGQYDDLERPGQAILLDNDRPDAGGGAARRPGRCDLHH
ncbi:hypothetical protein OJJOAM_003073 [Cupriavidus sp. H18C1]